jgi:thiopurine S-methyltransferase
MEPQFWIDSWAKGGSCTSFHRPDIHPYVVKYLTPGFLAGKRVLVPLCGKTVDLLWFRQHAAHVVGVELCERAVRRFLDEQAISYVRLGNRFEAERLTLICQDIFTLGPAEIGPVDFVYDRAALVALPLPMRLRYVVKIDELTTCGAVQFVNTVQYHPILDTPPFSIGPDDIERYHGGRYLIEHVECAARPNHGMVRKFNLDWLVEHGFWLRRVSH